MDYEKLESTLNNIYSFGEEFNTFIVDMRELVKTIDLPYQQKYVELFFKLYSSVYELSQTHDNDEVNFDTLAKDYYNCVDAYSDYVKFLDLLEIENKNYVINFNDLKSLMDCIFYINESYLDDIEYLKSMSDDN
jgi:hypothetical protein